MSFIPSGTRAVIVTCLVFVLVALAVAVAQQPPPKFSAAVEAVVLDVSVLDKDRRPVRGLAAADFTILEDGKPQDIRTFKAIDMDDVVETLPAPWVREIAPDVQKNTDVSDRRIVAIVMDDATPMPMQEVPMAKAVARQVIDALGPNDLACVTYALYRRAGQQFTTDRTRLLAAVDRFNGAIEGAGIDEKGNFHQFIPFDKFNATVTTLYRNTLRLVQGMAEELAALPARRKALVLVSVGIPMEAHAIDVGAAASGNVGAAEALRDVWRSVQTSLEAARQANVTIYGLDPGGLRAPGSVKTADPLAPGRLNMDFLKTVSENTGGFAITDTNSPEPGIQQLLRENASYYLLGYAPSNARSEGRYRRIQVRVNRPGITVRTREGYFEADPTTTKKAPASPPGASGAIVAILPKTDLPMSLAAATFALPGEPNAAVALVLRLERPAPKQAGQLNDEVRVHASAYAPTGDRRAQANRVFPVRIRTSGRGGPLLVDLPLRLDLPPGRYHLRVGAELRPASGEIDDTTVGRQGSVYADVDVPDYAKDALSLSGLALTMPQSPGGASLEALASVLPAMPTTTREFQPTDKVGAFLRVYQGGNGPLSPVVVTTRIVNGKDVEVFSKSETFGPDQFGAARAADYRLTLPIAGLARGPYLLSITATRGTLTAKREVRITLR